MKGQHITAWSFYEFVGPDVNFLVLIPGMTIRGFQTHRVVGGIV